MFLQEVCPRPSPCDTPGISSQTTSRRERKLIISLKVGSVYPSIYTRTDTDGTHFHWTHWDFFRYRAPSANRSSWQHRFFCKCKYISNIRRKACPPKKTAHEHNIIDVHSPWQHPYGESYIHIYIYIQRILDRGKTSGRCITQLAKISIDHNFIELTADERILKFYKIPLVEMSRSSFLARSKGPAPSPALQPAPASTRS